MLNDFKVEILYTGTTVIENESVVPATSSDPLALREKNS